MNKVTFVIVLFSLVFVKVVFNFRIPIDTTNIEVFWVDSILLIGYVYLAYSIFRFPVALLFAFAENYKEFVFFNSYRLFPNRDDDKFPNELKLSEWYFSFSVWVKAGMIFWDTEKLSGAILEIIRVLFYALFFGLIEKELRSTFGSPNIAYSIFQRNSFWVVLDRVGIILVTVLAATSLYPYVRQIGVIGIGVMITLIVFQGNSTALVYDQFLADRKKVEKKVERYKKAYGLE